VNVPPSKKKKLLPFRLEGQALQNIDSWTSGLVRDLYEAKRKKYTPRLIPRKIFANLLIYRSLKKWKLKKYPSNKLSKKESFNSDLDNLFGTNVYSF
jgi:hypothetical protein